MQWQKKVYLLSFSLILLAGACSEPTSEYGYKEITEAEGVFDTVKIAISDDVSLIETSRLVEDFQMLPLKTKGGKLIGRVYQIYVTEDRIYILDDTQLIIFAFDREGNELFRIDRFGRGPGEYESIYGFSLDVYDNVLELTDGQLQKVLRFNAKDGVFIEDIDFEFFTYRTSRTSKDVRLFYNLNIPNFSKDGEDWRQLLFFTDVNSGEVLKRNFQHFWKLEQNYYLGRDKLFYTAGDYSWINLAPFYVNQTYRIKGDQVFRGYHFDFEGKENAGVTVPGFKGQNPEWRQVKNGINFVSEISFYQESATHLYLYYWRMGVPYNVLYDKNTRKSIVYQHIRDDIGILKIKPVGATKNQFITSIEYPELAGMVELMETMEDDKEKLANNPSYQQLKSVLNVESNNPILVFYHPKSFN